MEIVRCTDCNKKLAEAEYIRLSIKCPRCGHINHKKAGEPLSTENRLASPKPHRSLDRR